MSAQTPREYLVGLGLAKPGRGKFSAAAHAALDEAKAKGTVFAEPVKAVAKPRQPAKPKVSVEKPKPVPAPPKKRLLARLVNKPILRKQETRFALTQEGYRVAYSQCFRARCLEAVSRCDCPEGPKPPAGAIPVEVYPKA